VVPSDLASEDVSLLELIHCFGISVIIAKTNVINKCRHPLIEVLIYWQIAEGIITVHLNVINPPQIGWVSNFIF